LKLNILLKEPTKTVIYELSEFITALEHHKAIEKFRSMIQTQIRKSRSTS